MSSTLCSKICLFSTLRVLRVQCVDLARGRYATNTNASERLPPEIHTAWHIPCLRVGWRVRQRLPFQPRGGRGWVTAALATFQHLVRDVRRPSTDWDWTAIAYLAAGV